MGAVSTAVVAGSAEAVGSVVSVGGGDAAPARTRSVPWGETVNAASGVETSDRNSEGVGSDPMPSRAEGSATQESRERSPNPASSQDNDRTRRDGTGLSCFARYLKWCSLVSAPIRFLCISLQGYPQSASHR
jgi:hypothetical protein